MTESSERKQNNIKFRIYHPILGMNPPIKIALRPDGQLFVDQDNWREYPINDYVLMLSTGLKDKNNNEIYEGDILKSSNNGKDGCDIWDSEICKVSINLIDGVQFDDGEISWNFEDEESIHYIKYCEIIGNIYQNPELLGEKK